MDLNVINKTFPVPEVSSKNSECHPTQEQDYPLKKFPQFNRGLCGICSMCSAIDFCYGSDLATYVYEFRHEYHEHFIKKGNSKKSPIKTFLNGQIFKKRSEGYKLKHHTEKYITVSNLKSL